MMAVLGLLPRRGVEVTASRIMLDGIDLRGATRRNALAAGPRRAYWDGVFRTP